MATVDQRAEVNFASLPTKHPIRRYCRKWRIENPAAQDELCEVVREAIVATVAMMVGEAVKEIDVE